jgi:DNA-binding MarR family transcriptional regulator
MNFIIDKRKNTNTVHTMNNKFPHPQQIPEYQLKQFQDTVTKLLQCCQQRMQYQSERFELPDAELRCLTLFNDERYLTPKGIAQKMNVVKSRVTSIINGLINKALLHRIKDPEDSRVSLLSLTADGQKKLNDINNFQEFIHKEVLNQMAAEQRKTMLTNLDLLKASMEAVKELMV